MPINFTKLTFYSLALIITFGLIGECRAAVISVNGQKLDSNTLTFTTSSPSQRAHSRSYSEEILPLKETPSPGGFWKVRKEWRAYWVKDWSVKKIYVPVWKRVWGPAEVREWVPTGVAKPHPGHAGSKHVPIIH